LTDPPHAAAVAYGSCWRECRPRTASPLLYQGYLYVLDERDGLVSCYEARTGKKIYRRRVPGERGFVSSPWVQDGKLLCPDESGTTHIIKAGRGFRVLGANAVDAQCWSSPAAQSLCGRSITSIASRIRAGGNNPRGARDFAKRVLDAHPVVVLPVIKVFRIDLGGTRSRAEGDRGQMRTACRVIKPDVAAIRPAIR
jgi:hypothetical protein